MDITVFNAINFFTNSFRSWLELALKMGGIMAVLGIVWTCIQIASSTMEVRKGLIGIVSRFCLYFLVIVFYPAFTNGLQQFAVGAAKNTSVINMQSLKSKLTDFYDDLSEKCKDKIENLNDLNILLEKFRNDDGSWEDIIAYEKYDFQTVIEYREDVEGEIDEIMSSNDIRLMMTINEVFGFVDDDGNRHEIVTDFYRANADNMLLKDEEGNETGYLSPEALYKINLMAAEIMWTKQSISPEGDSWFENLFEKVTIGYWFDLLLTGITCLVILCTSIAAIIQYIMAIIEYAITSTIAVILVPCLLFDGVKDMASKILPSLFAQAMKLCLCTLGIYYCAFSFINLAIDNFNGFKMSLDIFGQVFFTCLLNFVICANCPKIAVTLMTGQPQLSMGEVVQAFGAALGGVRAADNFAHKAKGAASKMTGATISAMGDIAVNNSAASAAWDAAEARGDSDGKVLASAAGMWVNQGWENMKRRTQAGLSDFAHGGGKGGGFGSGGGAGSEAGVNRYAYTGDDKLFQNNQHTNNFGPSQNGFGQKATVGEFFNSKENDAHARAEKIIKQKEELRKKMYQDDNMPENPGYKAEEETSSNKENKNA